MFSENRARVPGGWMFLAGAACLLLAAVPTAAEVSFDDSSDPMVLANDQYYEVGLSKTHGAITYIVDKTTGGTVILGNSYGDLWRLKFRASGLVRSSTFSPTSGTRGFSYAWDPGENTLTLDYQLMESGQTIVTTVVLGAFQSDRLDITATVENGYNDVLETIYLPSELAFDMNEVEQFYFPYYEGVAFKRSFFQELRSTYQKYQHVFMDFGALESTQGNLAMYAVPGAPFRPATLGLGYSSWSGGVSVYHHMFHTFAGDGTLWTSPILRLRVGSPILQTLGHVRTDRGWDVSPTLEDKAGALFDPLAGSFLVKIDCAHVHDWGWAGSGSAFSWADSAASLLPASALLHLVSFWPEGFDNYYPDYLPPNPEYGTEAEFRAIFDNAHARGQLVMPYTNPTWWDEDSPTLDSLGLGIAACDLGGNPISECYGSNCGYVICPHDEAVRDRLAQTVDEFTIDYPADLLFEDQVADRPWFYDTNTAEPTWVSYTDGLIANAQAVSQDIGLATEGMLDVLLDTELGFFDSVILDKKAGWISSWGNDNWVVFPLTMLLAHDKTAFYQHNLAVEVMTDNREMLTYNLSHGFGLGFDLTGQAGMLESEWLPINEAFQRTVAARCCGKRMTEFEFLDAEKTVTRSVFEDVEVVGNHRQETFDHESHRLAPQGFYAHTSDGKLVAGVFTRFNGVDLGGEHYLIQERVLSRKFEIHQPSGGDALVRITRPPDWMPGRPVRVTAVTEGGVIVDVTGAATTEVTLEYIQFLWQRQCSGYSVEKYSVIQSIAGGPGISEVEAEDEPAWLGWASVACYPNPFAGRTVVELSLPPESVGHPLVAAVYSPEGRRVKRLWSGAVRSQEHRLLWDGTDENGTRVASGVYFLRVESGRQILGRKIVLMR